jgi:hypothetical protein
MANRFEQLISQWETILGKAFSDSVYALRDQAQIDQIAKMLDRGDIDGAIRAVGLDPVAFRPFDKAITSAFEAGGNYTAGIIPVQRLADGFKVVVQFNIRNPAAEQWLSERSSTQVTQILDDQRVMIREFLTAGMQAGNNPRTTALDLVGRIGASGKREGGVIGLTSSQQQWARNYSTALASDSPKDALTYNLRDARFDRAVIKAAESGESIPSALQDKMLTAYTNRALRYRAETIARSESMAALHEAQQQAMEQAVESGAISQDAVTFTWNTAGDNRVRDAHESMDGQEVAMGEMFIDGDGNQLEFPGDPRAPLETTINCRCWREPSVDFLAGIE